MGSKENADFPQYETFICGETIDLVVPSERAIYVDGWHKWFNDPEITRHLDHGYFPKTPESQLEYLEELRKGNLNRLVLLIRPKDRENVIGVVSLSNLDMQHLRGETALVIGVRSRGPGSLFYGLEAKARIAEHGFEKIGLRRIAGGQSKALADWQKYQVLFGFRPEGLKRQARRDGHTVYDEVFSSCLYDDYLRVKEARGGAYWPGRERLLELMRQLPKESIVDRVARAVDSAVEDYFASVTLS